MAAPSAKPEAITVALSVKEQIITVNGFHFAPGLEVCPVIVNPLGGAFPCLTVQSNGSFSAKLSTRLSSGPGYLVISVEDKNRNVLAIDSVAGAIVEFIP